MLFDQNPSTFDGNIGYSSSFILPATSNISTKDLQISMDLTQDEIFIKNLFDESDTVRNDSSLNTTLNTSDDLLNNLFSDIDIIPNDPNLNMTPKTIDEVLNHPFDGTASVDDNLSNS
ncbi:unnamed protein product [Adineta steineri]|uniref:Uncharacterized protein n=1 Tax=Adineta steineri TaxID=433720 RepID=A0A814QPR2_9BILA|nr:unnamed protein product [Adineta steineri]CAF4063100.1 unnamed protein product [Adineta steineri]